jgi:hypothetical protein
MRGNSIRLKSELLISLLLMRYPYLLKYGMVACSLEQEAPNKYLISNLQTMSKAQNYTAFLHSSALGYHHTTQGTCIQLP